MGKRGVLLLNLGTPDDCDTASVRRYLGEFLMDPHVIDIPWPARAALVHGVILRTRPARSAAAYRKIWTDRGSPLLFHTLDLAAQVQAQLGDSVRVLPVMRYGNPSVRAALAQLREEGIKDCHAVPLYPQYSTAATQSSIDHVRSEARRLQWEGSLTFAPAFYAESGFVECFAKRLQTSLATFKPDRVLFSFHGLPERQLRRLHADYCASGAECVGKLGGAGAKCYRAQSYASAWAIAKLAGLAPEKYHVAFQSRLGRTPWVQPFSDVLLQEWAQTGVKRVLVISPSFVADCLETLEEIAIRYREDFVQAGGEDLALVPSLNADADWAQCVARYALAVTP